MGWTPEVAAAAAVIGGFWSGEAQMGISPISLFAARACSAAAATSAAFESEQTRAHNSYRHSVRDSRRGNPMLKLTRLMLASALLLVSGCGAQAQRMALQQSCNSGDNSACQQIAQNAAPANYPPPPNVRVFPSGQSALGGSLGSFGGLGGISGVGVGGMR